MEYAKYELIDNDYTPSIVSIGDKSTPVWRQNRWDTGEFAPIVRANGCGHCCTAMAAKLYGVDIDPYRRRQNFSSKQLRTLDGGRRSAGVC